MSRSNVITSYGIACVRKNFDNGNYEVLMIKKKNTYSFTDFVRGTYDPYKDYDLEYIFDNMTITEKSIIQSKSYHTIWMYWNGAEPTKSSERSTYNRGIRKFEKLCERNNTDFILDKLIQRNTHASLIWEIPKGRLDKKETPLAAAMREFKEETGVHENNLKIISETPVEYSFTDCNAKYRYIYFIAVPVSAKTPSYDITNQHMLKELSELKYLSSTVISELNGKRFSKLVRTIIKIVKKQVKQC